MTDTDPIVEILPEAPAPAARARRKPKEKPVRTLRVVRPATPQNDICLLRITVDGVAEDYLARLIPHCRGLCVQLEKVNGDREGNTYYVVLETEGRSCTCRGHYYRGACRHCDVVPVLLERGALQSNWPQDYAAWSDALETR